MMANITVAADAGFCPGVRRAVELLEKELQKGSRIYCLGELIHNRPFNESLKERGVHIIDETQIDTVPPDGVIFIRAHGETAEVYEKLKQRNGRFVDATCGYVRNIHRTVAENSAGGDTCVILGDGRHPEVRGIMSFAKGGGKVFGSAQNALSDPEIAAENAFFVAQTTFSVQEWKFFAKNLRTSSEIVISG